jgi:hypothetical protein
MRSIILWVLILLLPLLVVDFNDKTDYLYLKKLNEKIYFDNCGIVTLEMGICVIRTEGMSEWLYLKGDILYIKNPNESSSKEWKEAFERVEHIRRVTRG